MATRRYFLKSSAVSMFGLGLPPAWLSRAGGGPSGISTRKKVLVAIFQRGAADGLNMIVPFGDPHYYELRPNIAIPRPDGTPDSAVDLDGFFGLHPSLAPLKPIFDHARLAIVEATGSRHATRSHFDAQDYMESGTPGVQATRDGWLNRALPAMGPQVRAVALGSDVPGSLIYDHARLAIVEAAGSRHATRSHFDAQDYMESDTPGLQATSDGWLNRALPAMGDLRPQVRAVALGSDVPRSLRGVNDALVIDGLDGFEIHDSDGREASKAAKLVRSIQKSYVPANQARYPHGRLGSSLLEIARLIKAGVGLEVAFADTGGWDTHLNEVSAKPSYGRLSGLLSDFAQSIAAFYLDLGDRIDDVAVVTMSEFGRTARENAGRGTDHGHGNVMMVMGGGVRGGKVYGDWPGLEKGNLFEERDLEVTTDFRDVLGELVTRHLDNRKLTEVFPGHAPEFRDMLSGD